MNQNVWNDNQQQNSDGNNSTTNNGPQQPGNLLRNYAQQPPVGADLSRPSPPQPSSVPPYSPMPPVGADLSRLPQQSWPSPQSWPSYTPTPEAQGWVANTVQMVRRWSGRMAAVPPPVDQNPLVLYRPSKSFPPPNSPRWKRSRSVRVSMMMKRRRLRWKQARPKTGKILGIIMIILLVMMVASGTGGSVYAYQYYHSQLPRLQGLANQQIDQTTRIYDRHGTLLFEAYNDQSATGGRRTAVSYNYIPQVLQEAMVSAEDKTFWTNIGVDPAAIARAGVAYFQHSNTVVSGASTITQQLIKNLTGDTAITLNRKIPEAALAIGLTQQYTKAKILEMYFNVSPFGTTDQGIEAAVEDYFHLSERCDSNFNCIPGVYYLSCDAAHESQCDPNHCDTAHYCNPILGLARASLLAGMPQNPPTYDPTFGNVDQATGQKYYRERQQYVLGQMLALGQNVPGLGVITQDQINQAEALTVKMTFTPYSHAYYHGAQHFVQWVISQLESQLGVNTFLTGGFNVRTTIDINLESYVEHAVNRHLDQPEQQYFGGGYVQLNTNNNVNDAAVVVMNAKTGEVLAMDGSSNYNNSSITVSGNINMATQARQPGSSFKPIVYATAFQEGWYPGIVVPDFKTYFPQGKVSQSPIVCDTATVVGNAYCPQDYGPIGYYNNKNTAIHTALADSYNVPAVKTLEYAGANNVMTMARRLGITTLDPKAEGPSMALGTQAVPLIQMVGAYQTFANQGARIPPQYVLDIWDNYGHHLYHYDPTHPHGIQVLSPQVAYLLTSVLSDEQARAPEFWPDHDLSFWGPPGYGAQPNPGYPNVAAKTGTTDDFKDNLTIGYTDNVVVGVWAGNVNDAPMINVLGITGAAPIWHSVIMRVSGLCNSAYDSIPCGAMNITDNPSCKGDCVFNAPTFTPPSSGVVQQCVSSINGLQGSGTCDWMIQGDQPQQSGPTYTNNNNNPSP